MRSCISAVTVGTTQAVKAFSPPESNKHAVSIYAGNSSGLTGLELGFRRNAPVLSTTNTTSATACRTSCNGNSTCNSFAFAVSSGSCQLLRAVGDWVPDANFISGFPPRSDSSRILIELDSTILIIQRPIRASVLKTVRTTVAALRSLGSQALQLAISRNTWVFRPK